MKTFTTASLFDRDPEPATTHQPAPAMAGAGAPAELYEPHANGMYTRHLADCEQIVSRDTIAALPVRKIGQHQVWTCGTCRPPREQQP